MKEMNVEFTGDAKIRESIEKFFGVAVKTKDVQATLTPADFKAWINTLTYDDVAFVFVRITAGE